MTDWEYFSTLQHATSCLMFHFQLIQAEAEKVLKKIADQLSVERIRRKESKLSYQEGEDKLKKRESGLKKTNEDNGIQKRESLMSLFEEERPESCMSNTGQGSGFDRVEKGKLYRSILVCHVLP